MIFLGILLGLAAIVLFCWLLFTLAVFALPAFVPKTSESNSKLAFHTHIPLPLNKII